jgi:hypothetical protein
MKLTPRDRGVGRPAGAGALQRLLPAGLLALAALAGGCASIAGGNIQKIQVEAQTRDGAPIAGVNCTLRNDKGNWRILTPGDTTIVRSHKAMEVRCDKASLPPGGASVASGIRAEMLGNLLVIGGSLGAVFDHTTGAAYEYPETVRVVMGQVTTVAPPRGGDSGPAPTGYAALNDADALPYLNARGRQSYREWLGRPQPRAFAIAANGRSFAAHGPAPADRGRPTDAAGRAVAGCERLAKMPCRVYAVDDHVVWVEDAPRAGAAPRPGAAAAPGAGGQAAIGDVAALPYLPERGRAAYRDWLTRPTPKAFAISANGNWFPAWGRVPQDSSLPRDPAERAVAGCTRSAGMPCRLYAVNGAVVWVEPSPELTPQH